MRRVVALIVIALVGASLAGWLWRDAGVTVDAASVPSSVVRGDLTAIARSPNYACYLNAIVPLGGTTTSYGFAPVGSSNWIQLQIQGLALESFMSAHFHWSPSASELASARAQYELAMTGAAQAKGVSCNVSAHDALASMPAPFVDAQVRYYAASLDFIQKIPGAVSLDPTSLQSFYEAHPGNYDVICFEYAVVTQSTYSSFLRDRQAGLSTSQLAARYGGSSCVSPGQQGYDTVRALTIGQPLATFPQSPRVSPDGTQAVFVAATSRTPSTFAAASSQVLVDARAYNAGLAANDEAAVISQSKVTVDPAFARWVTATSRTGPLLTPKSTVTPFAGAGLT